MVENDFYSDIRALLSEQRVREAKLLATEKLQGENNATLYYLYGLACARLNEFNHAMSAFLKAESLDAHSPAVQARAMLEEIYAFRNTDMINP